MTALTVHNAEVKTATVEIKALTIGGKQVTLSFFRQLREERLVNHDGSFNGTPWGIVNYHPTSACANLSEHWHVVWQCGDELFRSRILIFGRDSLYETDDPRVLAARQRDEAARDRIAELPQLFIAV